MKKNLHYAVLVFGLIPATLGAQTITAFSNQSTLLPYQCHSGNAVGVCDMNGDFKDDIIRDSSNKKMFISYQALPNATFPETRYTGTFGSPWGLCVGDYNNDGYNDVFQGSSSNGYLLTSSASTTFSYQNLTTTYGGGSVFTQGCNFADINNDGNLDLFICHDTGKPKVYMGDGTSTGWVFNNQVMPLSQYPILMDPDSNSGNYASIWTDINNDGYIDMMITHCRQGITNPSDPRRIDQIFINNGNWTYTQDTSNWTGLRDGGQGWSTAWGDCDNDGDMDAFVLNYNGEESTLMINNGAGVFTDNFTGSGIGSTIPYFGENATWHDFDNDGFLDLLITGGETHLYRNNGNTTFTEISSPFPYSSNTIRGQGVGDLNEDGFLDVYASYASLYNSPSSTRYDHLWMNTCVGNGNHYVKFNMVGGATSGMSNKNGIGSIVKIYGAWGVQVREVRSGEAYGIQNSLSVYFGLGTSTSIDSMVVIWPSGVVDHLVQLGADQAYTVYEGSSPLSVTSPALHPFRMIMAPNPMTDHVSITMFNTEQYGLSTITINIVDITGKIVRSEQHLTSNTVVIDNTGLAAGLYMVQVNSGDTPLQSAKLIVQ